MTAPPHYPPDDQSGIDFAALTASQQRSVRRIARDRRISVDDAMRLVMGEGLRQVQLRELVGKPPLPSMQRRH